MFTVLPFFYALLAYPYVKIHMLKEEAVISGPYCSLVSSAAPRLLLHVHLEDSVAMLMSLSILSTVFEREVSSVDIVTRTTTDPDG